MSDKLTQQNDGLVVQEARPQLKKPQLYKVILLNDDYTPMEFVVRVLERYFHKSREEATHIMLHVHQKGTGNLRCVYARSGGNQGAAGDVVCSRKSAPAAMQHGTRVGGKAAPAFSAPPPSMAVAGTRFARLLT